jgi:cholesterol transport system auxiliary component
MTGSWTARVSNGALLVLASALAACSGLHSSEPTTQVYPLLPQYAAAAPTTAAGTAPAAATLAVLLPSAVPALNNGNIALLRADGALDAYASSRWPGELAEELQPLIVQAVRAAGRFASVQSESGPFASDYLLQVEIQQFAAVYSGDVKTSLPTVQVRLVATLGRGADRSVLRTFAIEESVPVSSNRMSAVIAAFNRATAATLQKIAAGTVPP